MFLSVMMLTTRLRDFHNNNNNNNSNARQSRKCLKCLTCMAGDRHDLHSAILPLWPMSRVASPLTLNAPALENQSKRCNRGTQVFGTTA